MNIDNNPLENNSNPLEFEKKCKYCWNIKDETNEQFLNPCKCTDPICRSCLQKKINISRNYICEICRSVYIISPDINIIRINVTNPTNPTNPENNTGEFQKLLRISVIYLLLILMFVGIWILFVKYYEPQIHHN